MITNCDQLCDYKRQSQKKPSMEQGKPTRQRGWGNPPGAGNMEINIPLSCTMAQPPLAFIINDIIIVPDTQNQSVQIFLVSLFPWCQPGLVRAPPFPLWTSKRGNSRELGFFMHLSPVASVLMKGRDSCGMHFTTPSSPRANGHFSQRQGRPQSPSQHGIPGVQEMIPASDQATCPSTLSILTR